MYVHLPFHVRVVKKWFRDSFKQILVYFGVRFDDWETLNSDRGQWKAVIFTGAELSEAARADWIKLKRTCRKREPLLANCGEM